RGQPQEPGADRGSPARTTGRRWRSVPGAPHSQGTKLDVLDPAALARGAIAGGRGEALRTRARVACAGEGGGATSVEGSAAPDSMAGTAAGVEGLGRFDRAGRLPPAERRSASGRRPVPTTATRTPTIAAP